MTKATIEHRDFILTEVEVRSADENGGPLIMRGYAAVFDKASRDLGGFREFISRGAFLSSLNEANSGSADDNIYAVWGHDMNQPLGSLHGGKLRLVEDERGLKFELDTFRFTPAMLDAVKDNEVRMSFGFYVREQLWRTALDGMDERVLHDVKLIEVSPVISPAYPDTSAAVRQYRSWKSSEVDRGTIQVIEDADAIGEAEEVDKRARADAWEAKRVELLLRHKANIGSVEGYRVSKPRI